MIVSMQNNTVANNSTTSDDNGIIIRSAASQAVGLEIFNFFKEAEGPGAGNITGKNVGR